MYNIVLMSYKKVKELKSIFLVSGSYNSSRKCYKQSKEDQRYLDNGTKESTGW